MLHHLPLGVLRPAADEERDGLDVAALSRRLARGGGASGLRCGPGRREALLQEQADRRAGVGEREAGIERHRLAKRVRGFPAPAEELPHRLVVAIDSAAGCLVVAGRP